MLESARFNSIGATDIRRARGEIETVDIEMEREDGTKVRLHNVDRVQDFLTRYQKRREISEREAKAGHRFGRDAEAMDVGIKSCFNHAQGGDVHGALMRLGFTASQASMRTRRAMEALGPTAEVVVWVAVLGKSAHEWATERGRPPRDGIANLRTGLSALVFHYGLDR